MRFLTEMRYALRSLRHSSGFTLTVVLTLGLGLGLCTTILVVVNGYLLSGLPYPASERLYWVRYSAPGEDWPREMERLEWRSLDDVVEHRIAWDLDMFYVLGSDHAVATPGAWVTPGFLDGFGVQPAIGRSFDAAAFEPGSPNVALISHQLWTTRFGADPGAIGRTFTAYVSDRPEEAESFTIAGVLPADFWHINPYTDIIVPLREETFPYMVRLRPGTSPDEVAGRVRTLVSRGAQNVPPNWRPALRSSHEEYVATIRPVLQALAGAVGLVFLVACANVAGLMIVRALRRQKEIAVRTALGARPGAIASMLAAEGALVGIASVGIALFVAAFALDVLAPLVQQQLGRPAPGGNLSLALSSRMVMACVALGMATAVACTMVPLATSIRPQALGAIESGSRTTTEGVRSRRMRAALIGLEIAASLALIVGSALMLRTVGNLLYVDLGIRPERVLTASITLRANRYPDAASRAAVFERITDRLRAMPGVEAASATSAWPAQPSAARRIIAIDPGGSRTTTAAVQTAGAAFFETLQVPIVAGRAISAEDRAGSEPVAVISRSLAARLWPEGQAVGRAIGVPDSAEDGSPVTSRRVIGVAADVRQAPNDADRADVYVPMLQAPARFAFVLVRTTGDPAALAPAFGSAFREIDPEIAVHRPQSLAAAIGSVVNRPRFLAFLLAAFAGAAGLLALIGIYGVIAYAVRQREREIAIRVAIGADPSRLTRMFVREGGAILAGGLVVGLAGAYAAGRVIESELFGVTAGDPLTLAAATIGLAGAGLLAAWLPSRQAARTDPAAALRAE